MKFLVKKVIILQSFLFGKELNLCLMNTQQLCLIISDCGSNISSSTEYFCRIFKGIFPVMIEPNSESLLFGEKNLNETSF